MNRLSGISKTLIAMLLLLVGIYSFVFTGNHLYSYIIAGISILLLLFFLLFISGEKSRESRLHQKIIEKTKKVNAQILSIKDNRPGIIILQLQVLSEEKEYITSIILNKSAENQENKFTAGQLIKVNINPKDPHDIILPMARKDKTSEKKKLDWTIVFYLPMIFAFIGMPIYLIFFDNAGEKFQDISFIHINGKPDHIWEVKFQPPKKLYIYIIDPLSKETIKTIKEKKETDLNNYTNFSIIQQGSKVFIIGTGTSPVLDIYDAVSFEKLSDIKKFGQSNKKLKEGISDIQFRSYSNWICKESVIIITTNDGEKFYYNISKDKFYRSENNVTDDFEAEDYLQISKQMFSFVLSTKPNSYNKYQVHIVESANKKSIKTLLDLNRRKFLNVDDFNGNKKYQYKYCTMKSISGDKYFFDCKFIYTDSLVAVIEHYPSVKKNVEEEISGMDKTGKTLFNIKQSDYPNSKDMTKDHFTPRQHEELKTFRNGDQLILLFDLYGALSVDIKTGKIVWKYEPS